MAGTCCTTCKPRPSGRAPRRRRRRRLSRVRAVTCQPRETCGHPTPVPLQLLPLLPLLTERFPFCSLAGAQRLPAAPRAAGQGYGALPLLRLPTVTKPPAAAALRDATCTQLTDSYLSRASNQRMRELRLDAEEQRRALYSRSSGGSSSGTPGGLARGLARLPAGMLNLGNTCYLNAVLQVRLGWHVGNRRPASKRGGTDGGDRPDALHATHAWLPHMPGMRPACAGAAQPALVHFRPQAGAAAAGGGAAAPELQRRLLCTARLCDS